MRIMFVIIAMLYSWCNAASFDCRKARSEVERMICEQPGLSNLDDEMGRVYGAVLARAEAPDYSAGLVKPTTLQQLRGEQRRWIVTRDRCADAMCVTTAYMDRLSALNAKINIPQYKESAGKSDDLRLVGIDCDPRAGMLEVAYFTAYNLPAKPMALWTTFDLKTNSAPDQTGDQHVLAVHEVMRKCSLGNADYVVKITAEPGSWGMKGECGGVEFGRAVILEDGVTLFDGVFEQCLSQEVIAKIRFTSGDTEPTVVRMGHKDFYGYE